MAKKGKNKISKVKRNNQTTNKMKKQGKLNLQRHTNKIQKQKPPSVRETEYSSGDGSSDGEEWADMLSDDEQKYILARIAKDPGLLSSVPEKDEENKQSKKRKRSRDKPDRQKPEENDNVSDDSDVENNYEMVNERPHKLRPLLPIKTRQGVVERTEECDDTASESEPEQSTPLELESEADSGVEGSEGEVGETGDGEKGGEGGEVVGALQLMADRRDALQKDKLRIGALCSSLLEEPEKKLKNLYPILYLMEDNLKDGSPNLHSVRKLATLSALEVFKDILPDYQIRHQDYSNVKLKKDTLSLYKYEKELLEFYKRYLQRLEKATSVLRQRRGDSRKPTEASLSLALISVRSLCALLTSRPGFNYARNIAQSVVPLLGSRVTTAREIVSGACEELFKQDTKGEITLVVVRLINQLVKRQGDRLPPPALACLLALRLGGVRLDEEEQVRRQLKQNEKHKKRIINLSKKEKKRAKKLKEVEKELLETQAAEGEAARGANLAEVTRCVFHIYFRLLKTAPHSKLLSAVLTGLAKFTHVINLELYTELVGILGALLRDGAVCRRDRLLCVRAALAILAGAGDALRVDPARFHAHLYTSMMDVSVASNHSDSEIILECLHRIASRARVVTSSVLQALSKRAATAGLQAGHNATLAGLGWLYHLVTQNKQVSSLLELSDEMGSGRYDPELSSPEHCNPQGAALFELTQLRRHYHPTVVAAASQLLAQPPSQPRELGKLSPTQVFHQYDGTQLAFKPAIPPPKKTTQPKKLPYTHTWTLTSLKEHCESIEDNVDMDIKFEIPSKKRRLDQA